MKTLRLVPAVLLLLVLSGCSSVQTRVEYIPSADFAGMKTYAWMPDSTPNAEPPRPGGPRYVGSDPIVAARIEHAVDNQLAAQGFTKDTAGSPDFYISHYAAIEDKVDVQTVDRYYNHVGYHSDTLRRRHATPSYAGYRETYSYEYEEGTLILSIIDADSKKLLWRGSAQAELDHDATQEQRDRTLADAVRQVLSQFPPKPGADSGS